MLLTDHDAAPLTYGSCFAGVGGFDLAMDRAGMVGKWAIEKDPTCRSVLRKHWPDREIYEDVCEAKSLPFVDVICGGWPCQDLSLAGKRKGLIEGKRSGLFFELVRIIKEMRDESRGLHPTIALLENVPGLLSSHGGRDFAVVLRSLAELGPLDIAWGILDSQWFGVAQRRRRVFIVVDFGGERAAEILSVPTSLQRDSAPRREAWPRVADSVEGGVGNGREGVVTCALDRHMGAGGVDDNAAQAGHLVEAFQCHGSNVGPMGTLRKGDGGTTSGVPFVAAPPVSFALTAKGGRFDGESESFVAHSLTAGGFDASEDGTGRGTPIVPIDMRQASRGGKMTNNRREGSSGGAPGTGIGEVGDPRPTLADTHTPAIAFMASDYRHGEFEETSTARPLTTSADRSRAAPVAAQKTGVRRLTPTECERLQGFPDDWTRWDADGKEISDSARYRMLGNAVTVSTVEYLARRIVSCVR